MFILEVDRLRLKQMRHVPDNLLSDATDGSRNVTETRVVTGSSSFQTPN